MRKIISIEHVEERISLHKRKYHRTHAVLDDGTEAVGFGKDFKIGDSVEVFYHFHTVKMRKPDWDTEG